MSAHIETFETKRYLVREYETPDRDVFVAYQTDPVFARHHTDFEAGPVAAHRVFDLFLGWRHESPRRNFQFAIDDREAPGRTVGSCGLRQAGCSEGEAVIGIEFAPHHWYRDAGREVTVALIEWAVASLPLHTLLADTAPRNTAAAKLAGKLGFSKTELADKQWWRLDLIR